MRRYRLVGNNGPTIMLLPSLGTTVDMWLPQVESLSGTYRILLIDHPGHPSGDTGVPEPDINALAKDVIDLADSLQLDTFSMGGISLGGTIAMAVAAAQPERVEKLVLACTAPSFPPASAWLVRAQTVREQGTGSLVDQLMSRWFPPGFKKEHEELVAKVVSMVKEVNDEAYAAHCLALAKADLTEVLPAIRAKSLVIAGAFDPVVPPATALEYSRLIPHHQFEILQHSAHLANLSEPERFTSLVRNHLEL